MISVENIQKIVDDSKTMGFNVKVGDIAYLLLNRHFKEHSVSYAAIFGKDYSLADLKNYDESGKMKFLKKYLNSNYSDKKNEKNIVESIAQSKYEDISFEENKEALIKMLGEIETAEAEGKLEYKDAAKMKVDIRTKLNDKFAVSEKQEEQKVIVYPKFNHICEHTRKECWLQTKEFAMEHWGLIEDPSKKEESITL